MTHEANSASLDQGNRSFIDPWFLLLFGTFLVICLPLALSTSSPYEHDEATYHLPAVRAIAAKWPSLDFVEDSLSATSPGYHWTLAGVAQLTGTQLLPLRAANLLLSSCLLAVLFAWLRNKGLSSFDSCLVLGPLAASNFFVKSAAWVMTDNAGLVFATAGFVAVLSSDKSPALLVASGSLGAVGTAFRQLNVWLGPVVALSGALSFRRSPVVGESGARRASLGLSTIVGASLPVFVVIVLLLHWGGLVPPRWREINQTATAASISPFIYMLAITALLAPAYALCVPARPETDPRLPPALFVAGCLGLLVACSGPSNHAPDTGRWGGYLWDVAARLPAPQNRSVLFVALAPIGAMCLTCLWWGIRASTSKDHTVVWLSGLACWALAFLPSRQVFHRYFEPPLLTFFCIAVGLLGVTSLGKRARLALGLCTALQLSITLATAHYKTFLR